MPTISFTTWRLKSILPDKQPIDVAALVYFRIIFGAILLWEVSRYFDHGWIARYWIRPDFQFSYLGFDWVKPWPGDGMYWHFLVLGIAAIGVMVGFLYHVSAVVLFLGFTYVFLLEQAKYLNHFYLICLLCFWAIWLPANRSTSVDAAIGLARKSNQAPAWTLWILRFHMAVVYIYGGIAKINPDWFAGKPMDDWLAKRADFPIVGPFIGAEWMVPMFSWGGLIFDLAVAPALMWRPTRMIAFLLAVAFHLTNSVVWSIGIFPFLAIGATALFFPSDWPRRFIRFPVYADATNPEASAPPATSLLFQLARIGFVGYVAIQLLAPFRHWLYPGDVAWTEEGHKYSWRMKLRDKEGTTNFIVTDNWSGRVYTVNPDLYITEWQRDNMDTKPDMILQFVRFLEDRFAYQGIPDVRITADSQVSLNGRPRQTFIDPEIDLTEIRRSPWHKPWILPLRTPLPKRDAEESATN